MEAKTQRILKDAWQFEHLFPKALFTESTVKRNANVADTVRFIPMVVSKTRWQVEQYVKQELKGLTVYEACKKLWNFVKDHIAYKKDESGKEQIRSPRRLFWEKVGDCDCYTVFIDCCLSVLNIPVTNRIVKFSQNHFQHIYPIVPLNNGKYITMDCVVEEFDYEEPFTQKEDYPMELTYLDGVPQKQNPDAAIQNDSEDLGKLFDFLKKKTDPVTGEKKPGVLKKVVTKVADVAKKAVNVINKVNPATVLLRAGVLASLKLNMLKVSQRLKYAYLSEAEAQKRGVDMNKFRQLKTIMQKMEKIFYGAGGKPENLKEAILKGKGNENREVPLSGLTSGYDVAVTGMTERTPLTLLLGQETYYSEFMDDGSEINGLGELGEPVTATAVAAASGVMASIAALLKNLGNLFPGKKDKASADFEDVADANAAAANIPAQADLDKMAADLEQENTNMNVRLATVTDESTNEETPTTETTNSTKSTESTSTNTNNTPQPGFWEKNKKWLKPTLWGTGILTALGLGYLVLKPKAKKQKGENKSTLSGLKSKKKKNKKVKSIQLK